MKRDAVAIRHPRPLVAVEHLENNQGG